jgi:hypothetical protein
MRSAVWMEPRLRAGISYDPTSSWTPPVKADRRTKAKTKSKWGDGNRGDRAA